MHSFTHMHTPPIHRHIQLCHTHLHIHINTPFCHIPLHTHSTPTFTYVKLPTLHICLPHAHSQRDPDTQPSFSHRYTHPSRTHILCSKPTTLNVQEKTLYVYPLSSQCLLYKLKLIDKCNTRTKLCHVFCLWMVHRRVNSLLLLPSDGAIPLAQMEVLCF